MDRDLAIAKEYSAGASVTDLAKTAGLSASRIYQILKVKGATRTQSEANRRFNLREDYFDSLDERSAYWLGFILADGCIYENRLKITLSATDKVHLAKFRDELTDAPISITTKGKYHEATLVITSDHISDSLRRLGIKPRKSLSHGTPDIDDDLLPCLYMGYFDGDGSIFKPSNRRGHTYITSILGSKQFCYDLHDWAADNCYCNFSINTTRPITELRGATETTFRFLTKLYSKSPERLNRKFHKYLNAVDDHRSKRSRTKTKLGNVWNDAMDIYAASKLPSAALIPTSRAR